MQTPFFALTILLQFYTWLRNFHRNSQVTCRLQSEVGCTMGMYSYMPMGYTFAGYLTT